MKRTKGNIRVDYGIREFFKYYNETYENRVSKQVFHSVIEELNSTISREIIYNGYEFVFPNIRFNLSIVKKKYKLKLDENGNVITRFLTVDYPATKKLWKELYPDKTMEEILLIKDRPRIFIKNKHSAGYVYKWYLNRYRSNCVNKSVYWFDPSRTNARELAKYIKSPDFEDKFYEY